MQSNGATELDAEQLEFFVYGTLRHGCFNYDGVLKGRTSAERPAWLVGATLYDAGGFPFAVVNPDQPDNVVVGELMTVKPAQYAEVLRELDELEDFDPQDPDNLYQRVAITVQTDGGPVRAWIYRAGSSVEQDCAAEDIIPGGDWVLFEAQKHLNTAPTVRSSDHAS